MREEDVAKSVARPSAGLAGDPRVWTIGHPDEVLSCPGLSSAEKRAILANWASDAHAVEDAPELRQLESGAIVRLDAVLSALRRLDEPRDEPKPRAVQAVSLLGRRSPLPRSSRRLALGRPREDDDDPPPAGGRAQRPRPPIRTEAIAETQRAFRLRAARFRGRRLGACRRAAGA